MPDVTIIGAGPAGSTAAILLARAGWDVTLVEQSRFPRDKVCGECLSALGFDVLRGLGPADGLFARGAVRLDRAEVHASSGRSLRVDLPVPMWGISRRAFDDLLLSEACSAGTRVRQPARCESLAVGPGDHSLPLLRVRDLITNTIESLTPSHLILADGKASFASDVPPTTGEFGIKAHFENVDGPRDRIELFGLRGSYGGLAAIEGLRWNAAFSVPAVRLKAHRGNVASLFADLMRENPTLGRRLAGARRVGDWLASPLPRFPVRRAWPPGVIPVGNAAAALEPIGGEGMGLAMRSAELAARALLAASDRRALPRAYRKLWRTRRAACRAAALAASSPAVASFVVAAGGLSARLVRAALPLFGKSAGTGDLTPRPAALPHAP